MNKLDRRRKGQLFFISFFQYFRSLFYYSKRGPGVVGVEGLRFKTSLLIHTGSKCLEVLPKNSIFKGLKWIC
jgi:hypothetical protein